jgi:hypothetical protein
MVFEGKTVGRTVLGEPSRDGLRGWQRHFGLHTQRLGGDASHYQEVAA